VERGRACPRPPGAPLRFAPEKLTSDGYKFIFTLFGIDVSQKYWQQKKVTAQVGSRRLSENNKSGAKSKNQVK